MQGAEQGKDWLAFAFAVYGAIVASSVALYQFLRDRPEVRVFLMWTEILINDEEFPVQLWQIKVVNHRKRPITEVYLPLGDEYKGGFKLALKNIALVADPPYGVKGKIKKTLRRQGKKHDLRRAAERALEEAGIIDKAQIGLRDRIRREESLDD